MGNAVPNPFAARLDPKREPATVESNPSLVRSFVLPFPEHAHQPIPAPSQRGFEHGLGAAVALAVEAIPGKPRAHETVVRLAASEIDVWDALTTESGLERWFAPKNIVEPGPGGFMIWNCSGFERKTCVETWKPHSHLRLIERRDNVPSSRNPAKAVPARRLIQDFFLTPDGGETLLRLRHSGFGKGHGWDLQFEATRQCWRHLFQRLAMALGPNRDLPVFNTVFSQISRGNSIATVLRRVERLIDEPFEMLQSGSLEFHGLLTSRKNSSLGVSALPVVGGTQIHLHLQLFDQPDAADFAEMWKERLWQSLW